MPEEVKFTEEELTQVQNIQKAYVNIQQSFGQLKLAELKLKEQEDELTNNLSNIQTEEKKFLDSITKKYGTGTLNPETGLFVPNKSE